MRRIFLLLTILACVSVADAQVVGRTRWVYYWFDQITPRTIIDEDKRWIDARGLSTGLHFVHFQVTNGDGVDGPVRSKAFLVLNEDFDLVHTSEYQGVFCWFDDQTVHEDFSNRKPLDVSALSTGLHAVHLQLMDIHYNLCPVQSKFFLNLEREAEKLYYWFDDATTHSLMDIDGTEINVEDLAYGHHTLHAMLANSRGNVVSTEEQTADFVIVCPDGEHVDAGNDGICDVCDELLSYTRSTTADRYGTVCLPRGAAASDITGATIYSVAGKRVDSNGNPTSLVLEEVSSMTAGQPYIFCATETTLSIIYSGDAVATAGSDNGLVGSFDGCDVTEGMYLLSNNEVVKCGTGCTIGANRAYINMDEVPEYNGAVTAKMAVIGLEGTDGINGITIEGDAVRYNLSGIRIPAGTKGIVIVNGKKVLNK